jgi:hypothetical protein
MHLTNIIWSCYNVINMQMDDTSVHENAQVRMTHKR